jgi:hypothetical protein
MSIFEIVIPPFKYKADVLTTMIQIPSHSLNAANFISIIKLILNISTLVYLVLTLVAPNTNILQSKNV